MITNFLIDGLYVLLYAVTSPFRLLPDVTMPAGFTDAMTSAGHYLSALNLIIPVDTILSILGVYLTIEGAYFAYKMIMWLIKRFPTQS